MKLTKFITKPLIYIVLFNILFTPIQPVLAQANIQRSDNLEILVDSGTEIPTLEPASEFLTNTDTGIEIPKQIESDTHEIEVCFVNLDEKGQVLDNLPAETTIEFPVYLNPVINSNSGLPESYGADQINFTMNEKTNNNTHLWSPNGKNDAYCDRYEISVETDTKRKAYAYGEVEISDPLNDWFQTRYHDGYQTDFAHPNDAERYSDELFNDGDVKERQNLSDGHINMYGPNDERRIVVVNKIEKRVLPKTIDVCFVTVDWNGNFLDGTDFNGNTSFHLSLYSNLTGDNGDLVNNFFGQDSKDVNIRGIFENNYDAFGNDGINDTYCQSKEFFTKDKNLGYSTVSIDSNLQFKISKYNDSYGGEPTSIDDFYNYSYELFDNESNNDNDRNQTADGHLVIGENAKPRKLFILNQFIENSFPVDIQVVKENKYSENYDDIDGDPNDYKGIDYLNEETNKLKTSYISYKVTNNDPTVTKYVRFSWDGHNWTTISELSSTDECPTRQDGTEVELCNIWNGEEVLQKRFGFEKEGLYTRFIEITDELGNVRVESKNIIYDKTPPADSRTKHLNLGVHEYDYDPPSYTSKDSAWALFKFEDSKKPVSVSDPNYRLPDSFVSGISEIYFFTEKSDLGWEPYEDGKIEKKLISYNREVKEACEEDDGNCSAGLYLGVKLKDRAGNISGVYSTSYSYYFNDKYHGKNINTDKEVGDLDQDIIPDEHKVELDVIQDNLTVLDSTVADEEPFPDCRVTTDNNYVIINLTVTKNLEQEWVVDHKSTNIPCPLMIEAIASADGTEFNARGLAPESKVIFAISERHQLCESFWCFNKYQTYSKRFYSTNNSNLVTARVHISDNNKEYASIYSTPIGDNGNWFRKTAIRKSDNFGFQLEDKVYGYTVVQIKATKNSGNKLKFKSIETGETMSFHIPNKLRTISSNASKSVSIQQLKYTDDKKEEDSHFNAAEKQLEYTGVAHPYAVNGMNDVPETNVFFDYIKNLIEDDVLAGYSDGKFRPDNSVTRGEMAKFIVNGFGVTADSDCVNSDQFSDVGANHTFYFYINTLKCEGIISGYSDGAVYNPDNYLTRGEATKFLVEAIENKNGLSDISVFLPSTNHSYNDAKGNTFEKYIGILDNLRVQPGNTKIINGYSTTPPQFRPRENITRGQMAKIIDIGRRYVFNTSLVENVVDFDIDYSEIDALGQVEIDLVPNEDNGSILAYGGLFGDDLGVWLSDNITLSDDISNYFSEVHNLGNAITYFENWSRVPENADCDLYVIDCLYSINDTLWSHSETVRDLNATMIGLSVGMIEGFANGVSYIEKFNDIVDTLKLFQDPSGFYREVGEFMGKIVANPAVMAVIFDSILAEYSAQPTREDRMNVLGKFIGNILGEIYTEVTIAVGSLVVGGSALAASVTSKILSLADKYFDVSRYTGKVITVAGKVGAEILEFGGKYGFDSDVLKNVVKVANKYELNQLIKTIPDDEVVGILTKTWVNKKIKNDMLDAAKKYPNTAHSLNHVINGTPTNQTKGLHYYKSIIREFESGRMRVRYHDSKQEITSIEELISAIDNDHSFNYRDTATTDKWGGQKDLFNKEWSIEDIAASAEYVKNNHDQVLQYHAGTNLPNVIMGEYKSEEIIVYLAIDGSINSWTRKK